ncbi:MAG TPA: VanZ family protein [Verrucomicrobiae bacterium]
MINTLTLGNFPFAFNAPPLFCWPVFGRTCKYWLPLAFWMAVIFIASTHLGAPNNTSWLIRPFLYFLDPHMSPEDFEKWHHLIRKCAHFTEYGILGAIAWRTFHYGAGLAAGNSARTFRLAILFCALYACTDEFHQSFVPDRQPAVLDVIIDTTGAACVLLLIWCVRRLRKVQS